MSSTHPPIAMTLRAEPGWRAILKKPLQRPPQPEDIPGEELYKLVVQPIRFWGFTVPVFSDHLRRKPVAPSVPAAMRDAGYLSELHDAGVISGASLISSMSMGPHEVVQPVALGKGRKPFAHLVDVVGPDETDQQALERIEAVYESERMNRRFFQVLFVMES